ncbi:MAG: HepT-like ribonuclease domain-containing protein [Candidatus Zixiibacteriota bacterium]
MSSETNTQKYLGKRLSEFWIHRTGIRDILIHQYFGVSLERTWKVVKEDIIDLKNKIIEVRKDIEKNNG